MELIGLLFFIYVMYIAMKFSFKSFGLKFAIANQNTMNAFNPIGQILKILFTGFKTDGMMTDYNQNKLFSSNNKGLLLDGKTKRLSQKDSFNHLALISRTGGGKTTSFVIPNIFKLAYQQKRYYSDLVVLVI